MSDLGAGRWHWLAKSRNRLRGYRALHPPAPARARRIEAQKSIPVNDECAASIANGEVIGCGGKAGTSRIGTSSVRTCARLAGVQLLGGFVVSNTQRSSA